MSPILTTDDEVLALAAKIKKQRAVDAIYAAANKELGKLDDDLSRGTNKLRHVIRVMFYTIGSSRNPDHQDGVEIELPIEAGEDIIKLLTNLISEKLT